MNFDVLQSFIFHSSISGHLAYSINTDNASEKVTTDLSNAKRSGPLSLLNFSAELGTANQALFLYFSSRVSKTLQFSTFSYFLSFLGLFYQLLFHGQLLKRLVSPDICLCLLIFLHHIYTLSNRNHSVASTRISMLIPNAHFQLWLSPSMRPTRPTSTQACQPKCQKWTTLSNVCPFCMMPYIDDNVTLVILVSSFFHTPHIQSVSTSSGSYLLTFNTSFHSLCWA